jgi:MFS transporter, DHA2 family, multidrug resistance protein
MSMPGTPVTSPAAADPEQLRIGSRWPVIVALMLASAVIMLDNTVLNVALPKIGVELHASIAQLQWVVTAYSLTFGGLLLTAGNLSDRLGRKRVLVAGLLIMASGSVLVLLARSAWTLTAIRALTGVGAALAMPSTLSLLYTNFRGPVRQKAVGIWMSMSLAGVVLGPVLAGAMLAHLSWKWLFLINIPVAALAVPVILTFIPESGNATGEPADIPGAVLSVGFMGALIYALTSGPGYGWLSARVVTALAAAAALVALFCRRELTARHPLLDLRAAACRAFAVPAIVEGAAYLALTAVMFIQTQLLQLVLGYTPLTAGLLLIPGIAVMAGASWPVAKLSKRVPARSMIAAGLGTVAAGTLAIAASPSSAWAIVAGMCVVMAGVRASLTTVAIEVVDALPPERAGIGTALNDTFQEIGGALGVALLGALLNQSYRAALPAGTPQAVRASITGAITDPAWLAAARHAFAHGATVAFASCAALLALTGALAIILHRPAPHPGQVSRQPAEKHRPRSRTADRNRPAHRALAPPQGHTGRPAGNMRRQRFL